MTVAVHPATNANPFYMLGRFDIHEGMHGGWVVWDTRDVSGPDAHFRTRPMALRWAAEQAGIQRQRVAWNWYGREWSTSRVPSADGRFDVSQDFVASRALGAIGAIAERFAEERYAALGVTA